MQLLHSSLAALPCSPEQTTVLSGRMEVVLGNPHYECRFQGICRIDLLPRRRDRARAACPHGRSPLRGQFRLWPERRRCLLIVPYADILAGADRGSVAVWTHTALGGGKRGHPPVGYLLPGRYRVRRSGDHAYLLLRWAPATGTSKINPL